MHSAGIKLSHSSPYHHFDFTVWDLNSIEEHKNLHLFSLDPKLDKNKMLKRPIMKPEPEWWSFFFLLCTFLLPPSFEYFRLSAASYSCLFSAVLFLAQLSQYISNSPLQPPTYALCNHGLHGISSGHHQCQVQWHIRQSIGPLSTCPWNISSHGIILFTIPVIR